MTEFSRIKIGLDRQLKSVISEQEERKRLELAWEKWFAPFETDGALKFAMDLLETDQPASCVRPHLRELYKLDGFDPQATPRDNLGKFKNVPLHRAIAK